MRVGLKFHGVRGAFIQVPLWASLRGRGAVRTARSFDAVNVAIGRRCRLVEEIGEVLANLHFAEEVGNNERRGPTLAHD